MNSRQKKLSSRSGSGDYEDCFIRVKVLVCCGIDLIYGDIVIERCPFLYIV
jgi:hypothetical protein